MAIRDLKLPQDLAELGPMLSDSFQYPDHPEWSEQEDERESLVSDIASIARSWWMIQIGQVFIPAMRNLLPGKVWEEDGRIAGVVLVQRRGSSSDWVISTVATRPEYRRRGIARKLVQAGVDFIREKGGKIAILDVIDANLPAYKLYESLGFEHFSGNHNLEYTPQGIYHAPDISPEIQLETTTIFNWEPRYQLMKRISPEAIQTYDPVDKGHFRQPGFIRLVLPLISRAQKVRQNTVLIHYLPTQQVIGYLLMDIRTGGKGRHSFNLRLDPAHAAWADHIIQWALHQTTAADPSLIVETVLPTWQQFSIDAAMELGFDQRVHFHRMGFTL